jgi:adenylosuccinate synthase
MIVVVDLGFGDSGKGLLTDFLVRATGATLVVRFNGGAQAGHNVVTRDGRHHTFSQFGAGTFAGARTFLSQHVIVHPTALLVEADVLAQKGITRPLDRVRIDARSKIVTPLHQEMNRQRERARGAARHGSCGVGVGEVVKDSIEHPDDTIVAGELGDRARLRQKLARIRERMGDLVAADALERWIDQVAAVREIVVSKLELPDGVVFEGAQGVLIDERHGFHPFTTWSDCTPRNALELARGRQVTRIGVLRSHAMRHGPGPLPTESAEVRPRSDHNCENEWQGPPRYGLFDPILARYALQCAEVDAIALTHLDTWAPLGRFRYATKYPDTAGGPADEASVLSRIETLIERKVAFSSNGNCASDVTRRP